MNHVQFHKLLYLVPVCVLMYLFAVIGLARSVNLIEVPFRTLHVIYMSGWS